MKKIKSKSLKMASIIFIILSVIYISIWFLLKSIINKDKVCCNNTCFIVEIADDNDSRQQWLMYREFLSKNNGMLFVFDKEEKHTFWMKNTLIPLDMIRINENLKVVDIQTAKPCHEEICENYVPVWNAKYVLEINAWISDQKEIKTWDQFLFKVR